MADATETAGASAAGTTTEGAAAGGAAAAGTGGASAAGAGGGAAAAGAGGGATGSTTTALDAAAGAAGATGAAGGQQQQNGQADGPTWREDWRAAAAGGNDKTAKALSRFATPVELAASFVTAQDLISSGRLKELLPQNATPKQLAEWRQSNGVPETVEGYLTGAPAGLVDSTDKASLEAWLGKMHEANVPTSIVQLAIQSRNEIEAQAVAQRKSLDDQAVVTCNDGLRNEMGVDTFNRAIAGVKTMLESAPAGVYETLANSRSKDGTPILSQPAVLKWLHGLNTEINPASLVLPNTTLNQPGAVDEEIAKIDKVMRENRRAYDRDEPMQQRYRDLLDAKEKMKQRAA